MIAFLRNLYQAASALDSFELWLNLTLKATLILCLAGLINLWLRRSSAAIRHWVWSLAVYALLLTPLISLALPNYRVAQPAVLSSSRTTAELQLQNLAKGIAPTDLPNTSGQSHLGPAQKAEAGGELALSAYLSKQLTCSWGLWLWISGALFFVLRRSVEIAALIGVSRLSERVANEEWNDLLERCAQRLKLKRAVSLKRNRLVATPITFGWRRPVILLPQCADEWSQEEREITLLHELAHIKRGDFLSNLVAQLAQAFYWYHPLVWWAKWRLQIEREKACDDYVVRQGASRCAYADHLLAVARSLPQRSYLRQAALGIAPRSELKQRIQSILDSRIPRFPQRRAVIRVTAIFLLLGVFPAVAVHLGCASSLAETETKIESVASADLAGRSDVSVAAKQKSLAVLLVELKHEAPSQRASAALALGALKSNEVLHALIGALSDPDVGVREAAVQALGQLADKRAFYDVVVRLRDPAPQVRRATVQALGEIGCDPSFVAITSALKDTEPSVRELAAEVLGQFRRQDAQKPLLRILFEYNNKADKYLLPVLGQVEDTNILNCLEQTLVDEVAAVRQAATRSFIKLGGQRKI